MENISNLKLFVYWLAITIIMFIIDAINKSINCGSLSDKGWANNSFTWSMKMFTLYFGLFVIGVKVFVVLTEWWFKS